MSCLPKLVNVLIAAPPLRKLLRTTKPPLAPHQDGGCGHHGGGRRAFRAATSGTAQASEETTEQEDAAKLEVTNAREAAEELPSPRGGTSGSRRSWPRRSRHQPRWGREGDQNREKLMLLEGELSQRGCSCREAATELQRNCGGVSEELRRADP